MKSTLMGLGCVVSEAAGGVIRAAPVDIAPLPAADLQEGHRGGLHWAGALGAMARDRRGHQGSRQSHAAELHANSSTPADGNRPDVSH